MQLKEICAKCRVLLVFLALGLVLLLAPAGIQAAPCDLKPNASPLIRHDLTESYCELCTYGYLTLIVANPYEGVDMTQMTVVEDLLDSGLTFAASAPDAVRYRVNGGPFQIGGAPQVSGTDGSVLTWSAAQIPALDRLPFRPDFFSATIAITIAVARAPGLSQEGLVNADRRIEARLTYRTDAPCFDGAATVTAGPDLLPLREPWPVVSKRGRNADAGQGSGQYSTPVYGNINDDVIWRIRVANYGSADLQDLRFSDLMETGNLEINYACPSEAAASQITGANGVGPGNMGCVPADNTLYDFDVDNPFGEPGDDVPDLVDVAQAAVAYIYLVGKVPAVPNGSCSVNRTNTVYDLQWGCEADPPAGGISSTSTGFMPGSDAATLSTRSVNSGTNLRVRTDIIGTNLSQPAGSKATVRITIVNNTGGTIKGLQLRDILPVAYVVDPTYTARVRMYPAYGTAYPGMTDRIEWTNPVDGTSPLTTTDPAVALSNTAPEFRLYSSSVHPEYADQLDMVRHGDRLVVTFRIVLIRPASYDKVAHPDVRQEAPDSDPPGTDPSNAISLTNRLYVDFEDFCEPGVVKHPPTNPLVTTHASRPEDLDIDIGGSELVFILTGDPDQRLPLTVHLRNNGGHQADDYYAYVSFGQTMQVVAVPTQCTLSTNPPPLDVWRLPEPIPPGAAVYQCTGPPIAPGQTVPYRFEVIKSGAAADLEADDLTFRADVVGEITLSDGTPLWFPTPVNPRIDGGIDRANNYSLDSIRARVIGFNLLKSQVGTCSENNPPPGLPDTEVQIGEECTFHIDSGGWFGFQTPGFSYIQVQDIVVYDQLPDGQGFISSTDPYGDSTSAIQGVSRHPADLAPLDEVAPPQWLNWTFNQVDRISEKDHWFRVDIMSRLLNDPLDERAPPNRHAAPSINTLEAYFQAIFFNDLTETEELFTLGPSTVGYPRLEVRRFALTVTEPHLTVVKEVCNESLYGVGPACSNFVSLADDGDAYNHYIYRLTVTNEARSDGVTRAPAYDVTVIDRLDPSDLAYVLPFASDGLDNDGDGRIDAADTDGEGTISDNVVNNGVPAEITFSYTHSSALRRIDAGQSVALFYRVDFDDDAAPLQAFTNTAEATYDSLEGISGNQSVPRGLNSEVGGARFYTTAPASATVRIIPVETRPKRIAALSNTPPGGGAAIQGVTIGEEIEYRLSTLLPVALLRDFMIRDELPAGLRCSEAPPVNLDAPPYAAAGFVPGGTIAPVCGNGFVQWDFGDQRVTQGSVGDRYDFEIGFIARVENTAATNDGDLLSNGHPATAATARYINEAGSLVELHFGQVDLQVREPQLALTKQFDVDHADAGDILTVTVTAENISTAPAYNLRVLDDLTDRNLTFVGNVGGVDSPDTIDTATLGAERPLFSWTPSNSIAPGATVRFTFQVRVDTAVAPLEVLSNTLQADWTSLPGTSTALNSSGAIGADGAEEGMRIGALPHAGDPVNDYETEADHSVSVPPVVLSKTDLNPETIPTIGARKQFQIDIRLPEGTTRDLTVSDQLNAAGVSYLLENNAAYDIVYTFEGIATVNGQVPGEAAFAAYPADATSGSALWHIGTVVTQTENDRIENAIDPLIRIHYFARINNDLFTDAGNPLANAVAATYTRGDTGAPETISDATDPVIVVEPLLTAAKTVRNVTPGKAPGDPAGGGDRLAYAITLTNSGTATAHDVNIVDTLSPGQALDNDFVPTVTVDGTALAGFVPLPAGAPDGPLVWGRANGDSSLAVPVGSTLVLTYRSVVHEVGGPLGNSAWADWTSLEGPDAHERTGDGCPAWTAPDDYCTGPATTTTPTVDENRILKAVLEDSYDVPPLSTANDAVARVGDVVTYRLALTLRRGLTRDVRVTDLLPAGMVFLDTVRINGDTGAPYTPPAGGPGSNFQYAPISGVPAAGDTGTLTWTIGDIDNDPYGDPASDILEIVYRAQIAPDTGLAHTDTLTLANSATLHYAAAPTRNAEATTTVHQPIIDRIVKSDRDGRTSPLAVIVADDIMRFRLEACNSGPAPAYNVAIHDRLAAQLDETRIANLAVAVDGAPLVAGSDYRYSAPAGRGGTMVVLLDTPLLPDRCLTVDYDIGFHRDFGENLMWSNRATVENYWSLPEQSGQRYGPVGPAIFTMHNVSNNWPPQKTIVSPVSGEAAIGEEIVYRIVVPADPMLKNAAMEEIVIYDTLDDNLVLLGVEALDGIGYGLTVEAIAPNQVRLGIDQLPAGAQTDILLRTRVRNIAAARAGVTFSNTLVYTFVDPDYPALGVQGGGVDTTASIRIVEPALALAKAVANASRPGEAPGAGDILRYTLTLTAAGGQPGDDHADAFDVRIDDHLGPGLAYDGNATVSGPGNTIGAPSITGDGVTTAQRLLWRPEEGNAAIDIAEGATVEVRYDVRVLDSVGARQALHNSASAEWTGIAGPSEHERNGTRTPAWNDYYIGPVTTTLTVPDLSTIAKTRVADTYGPDDGDVRIGDIVTYELRLGLQEGSHHNVVVTDTLPRGLVFEGVASINGVATAPFGAVSPFVHAPVAADAVSAVGDPVFGPTTVTWSLGEIVNAADGNPLNDDFVIRYRARVLNDAHPHVNDLPLTNTVRLDRDTTQGPAEERSAESVVVARQPRLTVVRTAATASGTPAVVADEVVTYTVEITNSGAAPAYDPLVIDTLPVGLRNGAASVSLLGIQLLSGTALPDLVPAFDPATGVVQWDFDTGQADQYTIPAGDTLQIVYQAQVESAIGAGLTLTCQSYVQWYYSFDNDHVPTAGGVSGVRQRYGPSNIAVVSLSTAIPVALSKENPPVSEVAVGAPFAYHITVPAEPRGVDLYDVRILDRLGASVGPGTADVDLQLVDVQISDRQTWTPSWTPVNTGTTTDLVIEDPSGGLDIPAGEQMVLRLTVVLADTPANHSGVQFNNTAQYTYNGRDDDPTSEALGGSDTTDNLTIIGPDGLTLEKSGPATLQTGTTGTFTLDVHNSGTGAAWQMVLTDRLPHGDSGGMCAAAPTDVAARIFAADGTTPVSDPLVQGNDFEVTFDGAPACTWTLRLLSPAGGLAPAQRLIVHYDAVLDPSTENDIELTNVAGVTRWYSADPAAPGAAPRVYERTLTNGTPGVSDHEDSHTVRTEAPVLSFRKQVRNLSTGQDPGRDAVPGDQLRYTIEIRNSGPVGLSGLTLVDALDRLNDPPVFAAGTLQLVSTPSGSDTAGTSATGGMHGTGWVHITDLALGAGGAADDQVVVVFDVRLAPVIASGTLVRNQAEIGGDHLATTWSDDPDLPGDADPTETLITSAPRFEVLKRVTVLEGDPDILMAGETLRYTLTVRNVGNENAMDVMLRDDTPAHTAYVPNSTTLSGQPVPDGGTGIHPLHAGILLQAPATATAGVLNAAADPAEAPTATITFDVVVDPNVMDGIVICNQGFVQGSGTGSGAAPEQPSDDPRTPMPDDPTCIIVGNLPLLYAHKTVAILEDYGSPGIVDPGDVLQYTIVVSNFGAIAATDVVLTDEVPDHTTYVADSMRRNDASLGADGGISPLIGGLSLHSADAPGAGIISAGESAVVTFAARVDDGVPGGTQIINQGRLTCDALPPDLTDADGVPASGRRPTIIVVGEAQLLAISKEVLVVGGGGALAGGELAYVVRLTNIGSLPAIRVTISDDLTPPLGDQVSYVEGSGSLNGAPAGVSFGSGVLVADFGATYGALPPGGTARLRFRVRINTGLAMGTTITNVAVVRWNDPVQTASAAVSIDLGGTPGSGMLNGHVWHDTNLDRVLDGGESPMEGWSAELYRDNLLVATALTDAAGAYRLGGLVPNEGTSAAYDLRFRAPGAGPRTASLGHTDSPFVDGCQHIGAITIASGANLQQLNLPLWPNGAVYNAVQRTPVAGARLILRNAETGAVLPDACFDDPVQQDQMTARDGFYKFDLNFSQSACPAGGAYLIEVTPPGGGYAPMPCQTIPPASDASTAPFSVPVCPGNAGDAVPTIADYCQATPYVVPPASVPPRTAGTTYYLHLLLGDGHIPGHSQVFNNSIPVDPELEAAVAITKTAALVNVSRGDLVPYTITVTNVFGVPLFDVGILDRFPAGFKYVKGSARLDGLPVEPRVNGRELTWDGLFFEINARRTLQLLLVVGAGVAEGEYVNRALVRNSITGAAISGEASATVRVVPDPTFDCTDVIGKVFDDRNHNGRQDPGEEGLAGVRVVTARGLVATSDAHGRFHITCAAVPDEDRGSNFILKLDERSLPSGYRLTTENPRVQRATRGKMLRFNFGATIHRVVRLDIADAVFEPERTALRLQWRPKLEQLMETLQPTSSVLRLSYLADVESERLVRDRLNALKKEIQRQWERSGGPYRLTIETELFWRRGAPVSGRR